MTTLAVVNGALAERSVTERLLAAPERWIGGPGAGGTGLS